MANDIPPEMRTHVSVLFTSLNATAAAHSFPRIAHLSTTLMAQFPNRVDLQVTLDPQLAKFFATASVEAWHRAVHSLLISCSLTNASPIWASVSGYYSSHYAMRALAHLLGYFLLYERKLVVSISLTGGAHFCNAKRKDGSSGEHKYYWKVVKECPCFSTDPLFTRNPEGVDVSDGGHRNRANYSDHIGAYPQFTPLDTETIVDRMERLSSFEMTDPPIPNRGSYPDVESVQIVAYHRIVRYRRILDEILGGSNRFWTVQRNPAFASNYCDYQITESDDLAMYR